VDRADQLAKLYTDLSTARHRLSIAAAERRRACAGAPMENGVARAGLVHAVLVDGCRALDRVAELPGLVRQHARHGCLVGVDLVAQADAVASAAARLAVVLRIPGTGFRGDLAVPAFARLAGLGPNETDESLILAVENVSLALSLAARLVLVLARLRARRRLARRLAVVCRGRTAGWAARWAIRWGVRVASLPLATGLAYGLPIAGTHPTAVAVAVLAASVMSMGRRARPCIVGPVGIIVALLGDLVGIAASVVLPHAVLLILALADVVSALPAAGRAHRFIERDERVGFSSHHPRRRRARREDRDQ
jgi:hypothetical protein